MAGAAGDSPCGSTPGEEGLCRASGRTRAVLAAISGTAKSGSVSSTSASRYLNSTAIWLWLGRYWLWAAIVFLVFGIVLAGLTGDEDLGFAATAPVAVVFLVTGALYVTNYRGVRVEEQAREARSPAKRYPGPTAAGGAILIIFGAVWGVVAVRALAGVA